MIKLLKTDMEKLTKLYEEKTKKEEPINLLLTLEDVDGITIEGLIKDIQMASFLKSIEKVALIGNKTWLKVDAKIESIVPSIKLRSEEHTSELQSRGHLVCRLLLEKKNCQ